MDVFGEWLADALKAANMSQADLAKASGLTPATISRVINGQRGVEKNSLLAIAKGLRIPYEVVFRAAGLLPPTRTPEQSDYIQTLSHRIAGLNPIAQKIIESVIETLEQQYPPDQP